MRTKRDEALDMAAEMARSNDAAMVDLRAMAGDALRDPFHRDSAMRLLLAGLTLPLMGIAATMTDVLPGAIRRGRSPELDEPAPRE